MLDAAGPLRGARVAAAGPSNVEALTAADGSYLLTLVEGDYSVTASADCHDQIPRQLSLHSDTQLDLSLGAAQLVAPTVPLALHGSPGPGPAQASLAWQAPESAGSGPVLRYRVFRDSKAFALLGNTLGFGDVGTSGSHDYAISAINSCGLEGPKSAALKLSAQQGTLIKAEVADGSPAQVATRLYKVLNPQGEVIGEREWRTIKGLGNCCEVFVATDASGKLYEYGGSYIYVSADEGQTWRKVNNSLPTVYAEGAMVGTPGGDVLGVNWDPYSGDHVFTHRYVKATDTWYTTEILLHQPLFDRPWVSVVEGPFEIEGTVVPFVSFLMSGYALGDVLLMSLDGLHYVVPNLRERTDGTVPITLDFPADPDRDWTMAMQQASMATLDNGAGLRDRNLSGGCAHAVLTAPLLEWRCPDWVGLGEQAPQSGEVVRIDAAGNTHITTVDVSGKFEHRLTTDQGRTWKTVTMSLPTGLTLEEWDVQVNAGLDQVVILVHAGRLEQGDQDLVFRLIDFDDDFRLKEILLVGDGDYQFGVGAGSTQERFDFSTVALLPSGHIAVSFGDAKHVPPGVAVEMGNAP